MRKLSLSNDAQKFVDKLAPKQFKQVVSKVMDLTQDAVPADSEKLKGFDGRRADMGEFRIVYHFDTDTVYIDGIGKRNDDEVYRQLRR